MRQDENNDHLLTENIKRLAIAVNAESAQVEVVYLGNANKFENNYQLQIVDVVVMRYQG